MKRFFASLATLSLIGTIGRHPAIAGTMMLLGVGGAAVISNLTTPTLKPLISSNFNPNQPIGGTNNGLKPNGGTSGAMQLPTTATNSVAFYGEMTVDPNLAYAPAGESPFSGMTLNANTTPGEPNFLFQRIWNGLNNQSYWWINPGGTFQGGGSASAGSSYATGVYPFTAPTAGCTRQPSGVWQPLSTGGASSFQQVDPGLGCPAATPTLNAAAIAANIPGSGAQQATAAGGQATTCSATTGQAVVTVHLAVNHGLTPGLQYAMQGFTTSPVNVLNTTFTALPPTATNVLVGTPTTALAACPTITSEVGATALSGTGASINFPTVSSSNPYGNGSTGIATRNNQHICFFFGEDGDDSGLPGAQFLSMVDENGTPLTGSPTLVPASNQGTSTFIGGTSGATLTVTAANPFTITGATYNSTTGYVTFPVSANPGYVPGSEFTVSGIVTSPSSPNLFNTKYIAVAGTSSTQVVGNPISGPLGVPQPFGTSPGTYASGGTMVSIITPGQTPLGTSNTSIILPYGTSGTTGTGADTSFPVTYALNSTPASPITAGSTIFAYMPFYYSAVTSGNPAGGVATARTAATFGDFLSVIGASSTTLAPPAKTGWGGTIGNIATLWGKIPTQTGFQPSTSDLASICTKQTDIQAYAAAQTTAGNPLKVNALYRLDDLGIWGDSSNATITGWIDTVSGANATLHVASTTFGSLALASGTQATAYVSGVGLPVASPITITGGLSTTCSPGTGPLCVGATYTVNFPGGTASVLGSSGSPVALKVGAWKPALPIQSNTIKGYIDTTSGVSTLHATSFDDGSTHNGFASFTGTLGTSFTARIDDGGTANVNPGNVLTVTAPGGSSPFQAAYIGVGTQVCPAVGSAAFTCATVTALGTGAGYNGTYTLNGSTQNVTGQVMYGSLVLPGPPTSLQATSITGTLSVGQVVTDGGASLTGIPLVITAGSGSVWTVGNNYYGSIAADATMQATQSTIVPGEYIMNSAITNPVKVVSFGSGSIGLAPGSYILSGSPNASGVVGSSGSPVVFSGTTITDGGAIAPGPALTIDDKGAGILYPANFSTNVGSLVLSGKYDVSTLGGTPTGIQVLVSNTANGPPLAGCTPCNWSTLTGTIAGGAWTGTVANIPAGGPYFVSVRAANGTAYATLPNSVRIGGAYASWGNGQQQSLFGQQGGNYTSWFSGLWGWTKLGASYGGVENYLAGPPVLGGFTPAQGVNYAGDRFGIAATGASLAESPLVFDQGITNGLGVPANLFYPARDGVGMSIFTLGNVTQVQTVGSGTGSATVWCSATKFCSNVDVGSPLTFNAASLTGIWFGGSVSGSTLTVTTRYGGALEPGMVLGATGSPTVLRCLTGCTTPISIDGSTWLLSSAAANGATGNLTTPLRADPPASLIPFGGTTTPWPNYNIQTTGGAFNLGGFGSPIIKAGTFKIIDTDPATGIGTTVCQDSVVFAWDITGGNCTGAGISSSFVNYQTGDYQVTFTTAPLSGHAITASWTNIMSPEPTTNTLSRPQNLDLMGDGTPQSGFVSAMFSKFPGGVSGQMLVSQGSDTSYMFNANSGESFAGYEFGGIGYSQMISWMFGSKFPALVPGSSASVPFLTADVFRLEGPLTIYNTPGNAKDNVYGQWAQDVATQSTFSGTVSGSVLTLTSAATGPMWEGEILGCVTYNASTCPIGPFSGTYITSLASGAWGANSSTYNLSNSPGGLTNKPLMNPVYYSAPGTPLFLGTLNDVTEFWSNGLTGTVSRAVHPGNGFTGGPRAGRRWAAMIAGANGLNASDPKNDRVKANATGCDAAALAAPCFDVGTTYQASHSATMVSSSATITVTGGISAHDRPFVVGQALSCSGCTTGRIITALDVPPTQDTRTGQGEVGQTFHITASGTMGASATETLTAGCSGTSGTGSNCIDVAFSLNVSGTFGTTASLDTCGANNLNGNAPNYVVPAGLCQGRGIGSLTRAFRIGTAQLMNGDGLTSPAVGSTFDDGVDLANGHFVQSSAFTCNIVAAKVVQCVKGPAYSSGVFSSVGQWASGSTYIGYGDTVVVSGRLGSLLGYVGGQSFPFTAGSGYTNGTTTTTATCTTIQSGGTAPKFDVTVSGGAIVGVVPANAALATGLGVGTTCTVALPSGGSGGAIPTIALAPVEGVGGIATFSTDNNSQGMFLYDNSGEPGNPLNSSFFTNGTGGYFEPGLPARPFGQFQGALVSG